MLWQTSAKSQRPSPRDLGCLPACGRLIADLVGTEHFERNPGGGRCQS